MRGYKGTYPSIEDFWAKVDIRPRGCWLWKGQPSQDGYGMAGWHGRSYGAHRLAYLLSGHILFPGMDVHHKCRNKMCCRPDHLVQLTRSEHRLQHPDRVYRSRLKAGQLPPAA